MGRGEGGARVLRAIYECDTVLSMLCQCLELHVRYGCAYWKEALTLKRRHIKGALIRKKADFGRRELNRIITEIRHEREFESNVAGQ